MKYYESILVGLPWGRGGQRDVEMVEDAGRVIGSYWTVPHFETSNLFYQGALFKAHMYGEGILYCYSV